MSLALRRASRELWPTWSPHMRARWVIAKLRAARSTPHYARIMPMTVEQMRGATQGVFAARTLREAEAA